MNQIKLWAVLLCFAAVGGGLQAQRDGGRWQMLGNAHVDGGADHDNIRVGRSEGPFRAIQLRVRGGEIEFQRVIAHFGNGQEQELQVRERIRAGGSTRPIDLVGDRRILTSVELYYARGNWGRRQPSVTLYGIR